MKHMNIKDVHVGQTYLWGDQDEEVIVLHRNLDSKLATVEFQNDMRLRTVMAEQLRPTSMSAAPAYKTGDRRVFRPIETVEADALAVADLWEDKDREDPYEPVSESAAEEIKDALSTLARDIGEDGGNDESDHDGDDDFDGDSDEAPHVWGTVDPYKGMSSANLVEFQELLHDHGFDMSLVELDSKSVKFKGTAMGFLWGLLSMADEDGDDGEDET